MGVRGKMRKRGGASHPCDCSKSAVTRVVDTRREKDGVVRIRECSKCGRRFVTVESRRRA